MSVSANPTESDISKAVHFIWLEITARCQLSCVHCYADSGPTGTHGSMTTQKWQNVIDEAYALGVRRIQFIGGEPTTHQGLPCLIDHSLAKGIQVEVFSNLVSISRYLWEALSQPGVALATSYYSNDASEHDAITHRHGSYRKTREGIREAVSRGIPIRAGVIGIRAEQDLSLAVMQLEALGVTDIGIDYLRAIGRGQRKHAGNLSQLCGHCADGVLAIGPDGIVWPCVFSRWLPVGNVLEDSLADIVAAKELESTRKALTDDFRARLSASLGERDPRFRPGWAPRAGSSCRPGEECKPTSPDPKPECGPLCGPRQECAPFSPGPGCVPTIPKCRPRGPQI
jgi:MoaA/NifB/PqqE/SkfB family radical SAM enzyme